MSENVGQVAQAAQGLCIVGTRIKEHISANGCRVAGDLVDELNKQVIGLLDKAIKRCKDNGRETVGARDL